MMMTNTDIVEHDDTNKNWSLSKYQDIVETLDPSSYSYFIEKDGKKYLDMTHIPLEALYGIDPRGYYKYNNPNVFQPSKDPKSGHVFIGLQDSHFRKMELNRQERWAKLDSFNPHQLPLQLIIDYVDDPVKGNIFLLINRFLVQWGRNVGLI